MKRFAYISLSVVFCAIMVSCSRMKVGSKVVVRTECLGCYDEASFDRLVESADNSNKSVFNVIAESDSTLHLFEGRIGEVTQIKGNKVQIRLNNSKAVWVFERHVKLTE